MKNPTLIALIGALALAGCGKKEQTNETPLPAVSGEQVKKEVKEAVNSTKQYLTQTKEETVAAVEKQLQAADARIQELAEKSRSYTGTAKTEAESALAALRAKRDVAASKLEELKAASKEGWTNIKASFDVAIHELEKSFEELKAKFSN
jgi:myosin heavy subunit